MTRKEAIKTILKNVRPNDIIVSSTGMNSRELYNIKDRPLNFYMLGSMGNALAIGIGLALNLTDTKRKIYVIDGDASALMSLGTLANYNKLLLNIGNSLCIGKKLRYIILDNNEHASTGGQITASRHINFTYLCPFANIIKIDRGKGNAPRIPLSCKTIKERFMRTINE